MEFNKNIVLYSIILHLLWSGCQNSFSNRINFAKEIWHNVQDDSQVDLFTFWRSERLLTKLYFHESLFRTNALIAYAAMIPIEQDKRVVLAYEYLSSKPDVCEIEVSDENSILWSSKNQTQKFAELFSEKTVIYGDFLHFETNSVLYGYTNQIISISLIREPPNSALSCKIISDIEIWKEIKEKMLQQKKWQNKFPWLYTRLKINPNMRPLWRDPDKVIFGFDNVKPVSKKERDTGDDDGCR